MLGRMNPPAARSESGEAVPSEPGWEDEAANWIAWARRPHDAYWEYRDTFFALMPAPGRATLEVGCGEGRVARDLIARGHRVACVDISPTLIEAARQAGPEGTYVVADAAALPFPSGWFDAVIAYNSLMDVSDMEGSVREAARVLRAGGRFCICVTHPVADSGRFAAREAGAPFVIDGSYLGPRRPWHQVVQAKKGLGMTFRGWTYPLEAYMGALEVAGLLVEALREPPIPEAAVARDPADHRWRRLPAFLMLRAVKPSTSGVH
jgi:SAM-dependent methyltransferase